MKNLILTLLLTLTTISYVTAQNQTQSQTPSTEQKITINPIVDDGFTRWGESWSYDKYISRSAKINSISIDDDYGDIIVYGTFSYKRLFKNFQGTFSAKINREGMLVNLHYTDADGLRDSKSF